MKAELINPFFAASLHVVSTILGEQATIGPISAKQSCFTSEAVNAVLGITGDAVGNVILGMSVATADKIASAMLGSPILSFDALAASAIAELANMISGNALTGLAELGYTCDLCPPTVFRGTKVKISTWPEPAIVVPLNVTRGTLSLTVSLQAAVAKKVA